MKLVHEPNANHGLLIRTHCAAGTNTPLLPGDLVRHFQDARSAGTVIAVSGDGRSDPDIEVWVLWTRLPFNGNYPASFSMPNFTNPCDEVALLKNMVDNNIISKKTLMEKLGLDIDQLEPGLITVPDQ